jgi:type II secretory pathway component GspD/PulD (secretin)/tetratricopeptide (TPR) repeat protein
MAADYGCNQEVRMSSIARGIRVWAMLGVVSIIALGGAGQAVQGSPQSESAGSSGAGAAGESSGNNEDMLNKARGEAALDDARQARADKRWAEAADAYQLALEYLPGNAEALDGLHVAMGMLQDDPSTIQDVEEIRRARMEQAKAEFNARMDRAKDLLNQDRYADARNEAVAARVQLDQARDVLTESEFNTMAAEAQSVINDIDAAEQAALLEAQRIAAEQAREDQEAAQRLEEEKRQQTINEQLRRVRELQAELKYREALQVVDEILALNELNPAALALRDVLRTSQLYRDYAELQRRKEWSYNEIAMGNQDALIVPTVNITGPGRKSINGIMEYPEDWPTLSLIRTNAGGFRESAADMRINQALAATRIPIDFNGHTFEQAVAFLRDVSGVEIYPDWKALELIGIDRTEPITLQLQDVTIEAALQRIMEQLGDDLDRPEFAVQDGMVVIASDEALDKRVITVVYDIRDLLFEVPYFDNAPQLDLEAALGQVNSTGGGGGGGFGGGGGGGGNAGGGGAIFDEPEAGPPRVSRQELVEHIISIIQENVDPEGWRDLGGNTGSLQELNGNLIITNTPRQHREIEGLLSQLREIRALQINVEGRYLAVSTNWFEQIGVDLDLFFNTNNTLRQQQLAADPLAHLSDLFDQSDRGRGQLIDPFFFGDFVDTDGTVTSRIPWGNTFGIPDPDGGGFDNQPQAFPTQIIHTVGPVGSPLRATSGFAPIGVLGNSLGLVNDLAGFDAGSFAGIATAASPALAVGIQFLDDVQVDLLIEATQADRRSIVMTAPRLTLFNGQRSFVALQRQVSFVSGLTPVTGDASGAFEPEVGIVSDGTVLDVECVISADRRYVTMTVIASLSEILSLDNTATFGGAAGGGGTVGGGAAEFSGTITLPEIGVSIVQTTVSVPDKGTVLLGGQRKVEEIEVEAGVPILSKIPFVNRFFTNRATSKDEQTLLILIRPEIIIQQENEDILFPGLSDQLGGSAYLRN